LTKFAQQNGGWVTSVPGAKNMRIELPAGSSLPAKLIGLGYDLRSAGIGTRITAGEFVPVEIIEITLSGK
jgi:hypothetical protein